MKITYSRVGNAKPLYLFKDDFGFLLGDNVDHLMCGINDRLNAYGFGLMQEKYIREKCKEAREKGTADLDITQKYGVRK